MLVIGDAEHAASPTSGQGRACCFNRSSLHRPEPFEGRQAHRASTLSGSEWVEIRAYGARFPEESHAHARCDKPLDRRHLTNGSLTIAPRNTTLPK